MIKVVQFTLCDNLLTLNHISSNSSSLLTTHAVSIIFLVEQSMIVSSANKILRNVDTSHVSFMYKINTTGPRIDPCGTPYLIFFSFQLLLLWHTY